MVFTTALFCSSTGLENVGNDRQDVDGYDSREGLRRHTAVSRRMAASEVASRA